MKWRSLQWRFSSRRADLLLAVVALASLAPVAALAQGGAPAATPNALCRCFVGDSTRAGDRGRGWALLGAAGLALLAGIPIGSAGTPAIPFVEGPSAPAGPVGEMAAAPSPIPGVPGVPPVVPALVPPGGRQGGPLVELPVPQVAFVPPKTATHLPLLAAAGVLLMAGGGILARRQARQQRRRRRRIVSL